jgi:exonuclease VII large subunit
LIDCEERIKKERVSVEQAIRLMRSLHPTQLLKRGYSYTTAKDGSIIGSVALLRSAGAATQVYCDGEIAIRVDDV